VVWIKEERRLEKAKVSCYQVIKRRARSMQACKGGGHAIAAKCIVFAEIEVQIAVSRHSY
jgi:hypothetical protein